MGKVSKHKVGDRVGRWTIRADLGLFNRSAPALPKYGDGFQLTAQILQLPARPSLQ
jgi:hypothetical protein